MTNYREILRLSSLGINHRQIAEGMGIARQTVVTALQRAAAQGLDWQTVEPMSDRDLAARLFPQGDGKLGYKMPDYDYVHRELAKPGVTQQLLWFEYCDRCRTTGEIPYQLTAFKAHYREYVVKNKATMHIKQIREPCVTNRVGLPGGGHAESVGKITFPAAGSAKDDYIMVFIHKIAGAEADNQGLIQLAVRMIFDILYTGFGHGKPSVSNQAIHAVIFAGCPFSVHHQANAFLEG